MPTLSFDLISVSTLTRITKKELEREIKIKGDKISLEEEQKRFIAAVRKRGKASCHQGEIKNERQRKKSEQEHIQHFLHKTCNWEVSRCIRSKQRQINVQKKRAKLFFAKGWFSYVGKIPDDRAFYFLPTAPDLSPSIPNDQGYLRFRVFISRQNLGQPGNRKIPDRLGFSRHMKTRLKLAN